MKKHNMDKKTYDRELEHHFQTVLLAQFAAIHKDILEFSYIGTEKEPVKYKYLARNDFSSHMLQNFAKTYNFLPHLLAFCYSLAYTSTFNLVKTDTNLLSKCKMSHLPRIMC